LDIKLKDNLLHSFRWHITLEIILKILACLVLFGLFLWLIDGIFNDLLAEIISQTNPGLYAFLVQNKTTILLILFILSVILSVVFTIRKMTQYILLLVKAIRHAFEKDETLISLPADFREIENQLNTIKYESLRNEQAAREAEQKKNDLVVYLAHDLKTPLTSVIGYLSLLEEGSDLPEEIRKKYVGISLEKALRLEDLINEFFDITRFSLQNIQLNPTEIALSVMMKQMVEEFYPQLKEKGLRCEVEGQQVYCWGDADKLARVFDNLLRNAILYSRENSLIRIGIWQGNGQVVIKFRNVGRKIPEYQLQNIFEKFFRLDQSRSTRTGGAGLGLAIAKEIVELHKGVIYAESNDQYTEFSVSLPGGPRS
jgi:two-component system, OmpR family, sensor histidine kinase VanS